MSIRCLRRLGCAAVPGLVAAMLAVAGCGQTGPLYLPPKHKHPAKTAQPAPKPATKAPAAGTR